MNKRRTIGLLSVTEVGLGCNNFGRRLDYEGTARVVSAALDAGINFFDTADVYGSTKSEELLGRALGRRRRDVIVATKFGSKIDDARQGARPDYVLRAADDSLRRLNTDYIDLYQIHRPDPKVPIGDTLGALDQLVKSGKVREIGCSNFTVDELREADRRAKPGAARFVSVQNEFSLFEREAERDVLPECERTGMAFLPYFPLASGLLSGKYRRGQPPPPNSRLGSGWNDQLFTDENLDTVEQLIGYAESRGHTILELAVSWLLAHGPVASVIAGATKPEQVRANAAAGNWRLTPEELDDIGRITA
ncbi:MAG TPA: aldo/keto reductase [Gemmatimonadaceae bacterium]